MNIKLTIEYDGTHYHGWQVQPGGPTIQEMLERGIEQILGIKARLNGSGRTDAGVHALAQVANFVCEKKVDPWRFLRGLNAVTPQDIVVKAVEGVPDSFDARRDGKSRIYEYRIWNRPWPPAIQRRYAWHVHDSLDLPRIQDCVLTLEGEHDFTSFQAAGCDAAHAVRNVYRSVITREGDFLIYTIEATAFLRHMVRNIVGTLMEVGRGERSPENFAGLLKARDRTQSGPTAPPHGLFLVEIKY